MGAHAQTCLYRHFDASGALLYVGISCNAISRMVAHRNGSSWFDQVASITIKRFATREEAFSAEAQAIKTENPLFNKAGRGFVIARKVRRHSGRINLLRELLSIDAELERMNRNAVVCVPTETSAAA